VNACGHTCTEPQTSSTLSLGLGRRIHGSVKDTKLSTNKQHSLSSPGSSRGEEGGKTSYATGAHGERARQGGADNNGCVWRTLGEEALNRNCAENRTVEETYRT